MRNGVSNKNGKRGAVEEEPILVEHSSGNVFADIGLPNPELCLAKAALVQRLRMAITRRKLSDAKAAKLLRLDPSKLAALLRGQTQRFSLDRLFRFLNKLGQEVEISVRPTHSENGDATLRVL